MSLAYDECADDRRPVVNQDETPIEHSPLARGLKTDAAPHPGLVLRRARESRGLSLEDLSRITKINKAVLVALETSDTLHLPAAVYTRGFVKSYAREVGLDAESTADEYLRRIEPMTVHHLLVDDGKLPPLANHALAAVDPNEDARHLLAENQVRRFGRFGTIAAAVGLGVYVWSFTWNREPAQPVAAPHSGDATPAAAAPVIPDATPAAAVTGDGPLQLQLVPKRECWVAVSVDGERVLAKLLQPGETQTITVGEEAVMRIGEPGALTMSINGQTSRPLGPAGQPVSIRITRENFRNFLAS